MKTVRSCNWQHHKAVSVTKASSYIHNLCTKFNFAEHNCTSTRLSKVCLLLLLKCRYISVDCEHYMCTYIFSVEFEKFQNGLHLFKIICHSATNYIYALCNDHYLLCTPVHWRSFLIMNVADFALANDKF